MFSTKTCLGWAVVLLVALASTELVAAQPVRKVTVSAKAEMDIEPNEVLLTFWVQTKDKDLLKAKSENDKITRAVLALAAKHTIPADQFTMTSLEMGPRYEKRDYGRERVMVGYGVDRAIEVSIRDFSKLEPVLADALEAGVTRVDDLLFRTRRPREAQAQVRRLAVQYAREKATQLAELNGLALGPPIKINADTDENRQVWGMGGMGMGAATPAAGPARFLPVSQQTDARAARETKAISDKLLAPGTITIESVVTITFEMIERPR